MNMEFGNAALVEALPKPARIFSSYDVFLKRCFDLLISLIVAPFVLLFGIPIVFLVMMDGSSPFFAQTRIGRNGTKFRCWKFRTMKVDAERLLEYLLVNDPGAREEWNTAFKLKNDPRVTRIGAFLRKTSLDELPQILNVIRGEMSIVGPRPVTRSELALYGEKAALYLACRPGVTGLWQISGRNDTSYDERVTLDASYAQNWSLLMDLRILVMTAPVVLLRRGAY